MLLQLLLNKKRYITFFIICTYIIELFALQLGNGDTENKNIPVLIDVNVKKVTSGSYHTIYIKDNTLMGTGDNTYYQLGTKEKSEYNTPIIIDKKVIDAEAGNNVTFYIKKDRSLWACGYLPSHYEVSKNGKKLIYTKVSKPICIDKDVLQVSAGSAFMYIKIDGSLWGFGENRNGQLGIANKENQLKPIKIQNNIHQVFCGELTSFYINDKNELFQTNSDGQFEKIDNDVISVSNYIYIKKDSSLWGYGFSYYGALGIGVQTKMIKKPVLIMKDVKAISSDSNQNHTLIITDCNKLYVCGGSEHNNWGQLGLGNNEIQYYPKFLCDDVIYVSAGNLFSHFIKTDNTLWGMGLNNKNSSGL